MAGWTEHISKQHKMRPYEYFAKDHLGNVRVVFSPNGRSATRVQEDHYYPFGMLMPYTHYASSTSTPNRLLYNSKELLNYLPGLRWYDYGARMYDAQVGRWHRIDPKANLYFNFSPNVYGLDNPLRYLDPNGAINWDQVVDKPVVTSGTGWRTITVKGKKITQDHPGLDLSAKIGTPVKSYAEGTILTIKERTGYGLTVVIDHGNGYYSFYAHLNGTVLKEGDKVANGQLFAYSGKSGSLSTGPHLHFGLYKGKTFSLNNSYIDPRTIGDLQKFIDNGYSLDEVAVNEDNPIQIDEVIVTAESEVTKRFRNMCEVARQELQRWMDSRIHPDRLYEGDYGYRCAYWESYDIVRNWGNPNNSNK